VPLFVETFNKRIWSTAERQGKAKALRMLIKVSNGMRKVKLDARRLLFSSILNQFGGKLHTIICGGAPLSSELVATFDALGITLLNGYGITECSPLICCNRNLYQKDGSVGMPILGEQIKIADPNEDGEGEICVKGPNVMQGYYNDPAATAAAFDEEGYFRTGDVGYEDKDGYFYVTGRMKNVIVLENGKNVFPEEIEEYYEAIETIAESAVIGRQDGETVNLVALVYPDYTKYPEGTPDEDIQSDIEKTIFALNKTLPTYKQVKIIELRTTPFEKTSSKKIKRHLLK
jgi:long-chain acyl-CoA synthetase